MPTLKETLKEFRKWSKEAKKCFVIAGNRNDICPICGIQPDLFEDFISQSIKTALESVVLDEKEFCNCRQQLLKNIEEYCKN